MVEVCTAGFLAVSGWMDLRKREISLVLAGIYACAGVAYSVVNGRTAADFLVPVGIGALVLALGWLSRGAVGLGDGWILLSLGMMLDTGAYIRTVCIGLLLLSAWAAVLLAVFKKGRKTEVPLVPFLFLGYVAEVMI